MNKKALKIGEFVAIYTDLDSENFGVGKIIAVDDDNVIISGVEPTGEESGLTLYKINSIVRIEKHTEYNGKIERFIKLKNVKLFEHEFNSQDILLELLLSAKNNKRIIDVQLLESNKRDVTGIVSNADIEQDICEIESVNYFGEPDGVCLFSISDISSIKYGGCENKDIELLYNHNNYKKKIKTV
ncbi:MAG: hypothetical protein LBQ40_05725 [Clostridiales bacterium]|jgi:hypothetical protein|nr:hypothetical protein [Clostridiales bacterium]